MEQTWVLKCRFTTTCARSWSHVCRPGCSSCELSEELAVVLICHRFTLHLLLLRLMDRPLTAHGDNFVFHLLVLAVHELGMRIGAVDTAPTTSDSDAASEVPRRPHSPRYPWQKHIITPTRIRKKSRPWPPKKKTPKHYHFFHFIYQPKNANVYAQGGPLYQ